MRRARTTNGVLICMAGVLAAMAMSGCYKRVTRAKGLGSSELAPKISEPQTTFTQDIGNAIRDRRAKRK